MLLLYPNEQPASMFTNDTNTIRNIRYYMWTKKVLIFTRMKISNDKI